MFVFELVLDIPIMMDLLSAKEGSVTAKIKTS